MLLEAFTKDIPDGRLISLKILSVPLKWPRIFFERFKVSLRGIKIYLGRLSLVFVFYERAFLRGNVR